MIYTLTFNPSLDYIMHVDHFNEGQTNRSSQEEMYPGGKGFNVSTILSRLNVETTALGFIAGFTGKEIETQLLKRGVKVDLIELEEGLSRINVKMKSKQETEINGSGPHIPLSKLQLLYEKLNQLNENDLLVLAGSIPTSLSKDIYKEIMDRLKDKNVRVIVDASGETLLHTLAYHPFLIKPNKDELEDLFHTKIQSKEDILYYAKELQKQGALNVLVSLGSQGALLTLQNQDVFEQDSAKGALINSVGSGDSMVAGFIAGYLKTKDFKEALKLGSACGGATAFSQDLATKEKIEEVYQSLR